MDYKSLGFKAGLEIHQQLDTPKLFSGAPSYLRSDKPHYTLMRSLHPVAGEFGEIDAAVKHEASRDRTFYYEGYSDSVSLVELDEEPPRMIDQTALETCLQIALLLKCEVYPVAQIMRKTVIDGSNTSGFQRTVLIGHDGFIETSFGKVPIESIALEEDSARIISKDDSKAVYRLDRLGIPLVEISTPPTMVSPEQVKEAALKIGEILRACRVKRGIGTIRQDVNVNIKGHEKVEIKGFQDPSMMTLTIQKEIERQTENIKKKKTVGEVRNALPDGSTEFLRPLPGKARMYPETDLPLLKISREQLLIIGKTLPKLREELRTVLKKKGLHDELIELVLEGHVDEFMALIKVHSLDAPLVAKMIALWPVELASKYKKPLEQIRTVLTERILERILELVKSKKLAAQDVKSVLSRLVEGVSFEQAVVIEKVGDDDLEHELRALVKEKPGLRPNAYMGLIMQKHKGKIDSQKAMELINRILSG